MVSTKTVVVLRRGLLVLLVISATRLGFSSVSAGETEFSDIMSNISVTLKVPIITEGQPLSTSISPNLLVKWKSTLNLKTAEEIIHAFDYDLVRSNGCLLLVKKYSNPQDIPCVNFEECQRSLQNLTLFVLQNSHKLSVGFFDNENLHSPRTDLIAKTFTPERIAFLSQKGILLESDLTFVEKDTINKIATDFWISKSQWGIDRKIEEHKALKNKLFFSYADHHGYSVLGYDVGSSKHYPLSDPDRMNEENIHGIYIEKENPNLRDITAPTEEDYRRIQEEEKRKKLTIGDWFRYLGEMPFQVKMEKGIEKKEISIFGNKKEDTVKILRSICEIYGLEIIYKSVEKTYYVGYPNLPIIRNFMAIPSVVEHIYPKPVLRMIRTQKKKEYAKNSKSKDNSFLVAVRRLRAIVNSQMKEKKQSKIDFLENNDQENQYFSVALITVPFSTYTSLDDPILKWTDSQIKDFVSYKIRGGVYIEPNEPNNLYFRLAVVGIGSAGQKIVGFAYAHSRYYGDKPPGITALPTTVPPSQVRKLLPPPPP
jgi:hypothetical protein